MNKAFYMLAELMGGLEGRAWTFGGVAVVAIMLISILLSMMITVMQPETNDLGAALIVTPDSQVQSEVESLMFQLRQDPKVMSVNLSSSAEGVRIEVRLYPDVAAVEGRTELALIQGVEHVQIPPAPPSGTFKKLLSSGNAIFVILGMGILLGITLALIYMSLRTARNSFAADLEILEQVGIAPALLRMPFALYGGLLGLAGAIVAAFVGYSMAVWLPSLAVSQTLFPELLKSGMIEEMAVRGVVTALLIGIVACLSMGFLIYKYPSPFSRSRISSSSEAVSAG